MNQQTEVISGEKFVREKILKENQIMLIIGLVIFVVGLGSTFALWEVGFIFSLTILGIAIGAGMILYSIFAIVYLPTNRIYKNWKAYGGDDAIIKEIQDTINSKKKDFESNEFIISKGWLIKPKEFIFVKTDDVNWIYLSQIQSLSLDSFYQQIKVFATIGIEFELNCRGIPKYIKDQVKDATTGDVITYLDILNHFCKNAIIGHNPKFKKIWKKSPKEFIENVKKLAEKSS